MEVERLRAELRSIVEADFAVPAARDPQTLALEAFEALGSPDPVLRDELAYAVLGTWMHEGVLSTEQIRELLIRAHADDALFHGIGEQGADTVFRRSFALLRDNRERFLTEPEWRESFDRIVAYCDGELDLRARVADSGWAHALAHVSDVVDELVQSRYATAADCIRLWEGLASLVDRADEVFQGEEDERVAIALAAMHASEKLTIDELSGLLLRRVPTGSDEAARARRIGSSSPAVCSSEHAPSSSPKCRLHSRPSEDSATAPQPPASPRAAEGGAGKDLVAQSH